MGYSQKAQWEAESKDESTSDWCGGWTMVHRKKLQASCKPAKVSLEFVELNLMLFDT
jgi:hypothetical protein